MVQVGALQGIDSSALSAANSRLQLLQNIAIQKEENKRQREKNIFGLAESAVYPGAMLLRDSLERKDKKKQAAKEAELTSQRNAGILDIYGMAEGLAPVDSMSQSGASEPVQNPDGTFSLNAKTEPLTIEQAIFQKAHQLNAQGLLNKEYLDEIVTIGRYDTKSKNDRLAYLDKKATYDVSEGSPNSGPNTRRVKEADLKLTGAGLDNQYKESQIAKNKADAEAAAQEGELGLGNYRGLEPSERVVGDRRAFETFTDAEKSKEKASLFQSESLVGETSRVVNRMEQILKENPDPNFRFLLTNRAVSSILGNANPAAREYIELTAQLKGIGQAAARMNQSGVLSDRDIKLNQDLFARKYDNPEQFAEFNKHFREKTIKGLLDRSVLTGQPQIFNEYLPLYRSTGKNYNYGSSQAVYDFGTSKKKEAASPTVSGKTVKSNTRMKGSDVLSLLEE